MASLRIIDDDGSERVVELRDRKLQIGRGRDNDIVLPDAQKGVSRKHAELRFENGRYILVDLQSQNGTWLNGQRIERAEVPPDAEITVGEYRLRFQHTHSPAGVTDSATALLGDRIDDIVIRERTAFVVEPIRPAAHRAPAPPASRGWLPGAVIGAGLVLLLALAAWILMPNARQAAARAPAAAPPREPAAATSPEPVAPGTEPASVPSAGDPAPANGTARRDGSPQGGSKPATRRPPADRTTPEWTSTGLEVGGAADLSRVARRPGESTDAWRTRGAALHTRYAYSKQALNRHDFAGAAAGFEAILMEEPGFLDAPLLLVQANAGLRVSARDLYEAGNKLDAVDDWIGAMQKYDQARLIHSGVPGLADAMKRVRDKLQVAGTNAFNQARQYEATGRSAEAVKEYEKAFQWLASGDPNREIARARVDQLKRHD